MIQRVGGPLVFVFRVDDRWVGEFVRINPLDRPFVNIDDIYLTIFDDDPLVRGPKASFVSDDDGAADIAYQNTRKNNDACHSLHNEISMMLAHQTLVLETANVLFPIVGDIRVGVPLVFGCRNLSGGIRHRCGRAGLIDLRVSRAGVACRIIPGCVEGALRHRHRRRSGSRPLLRRGSRVLGSWTVKPTTA